MGLGVNNTSYYFEIADSAIGPSAFSSSVYFGVLNGTPIGISTTGSTSFQNIVAYIRGTLCVGRWIGPILVCRGDNGNVGIGGITNPSYKLHVSGNTNIVGDYYDDGRIL